MIRRVAADGRIDAGGAFAPILRPRIVERIASAATQRIVLIVAPAGYGKSVALRQYLDTLQDVPYVRYDVRAEHDTLLGFVRGFADALLDAAPGARKTVSGAYEKSRSSKTPGLDLAMWMHAHIKTFTGVIAIDDVHAAENDPEVSRFLVSLIDRTKGRASWIIASRSSMDLPVGSWLAYSEMDLNIDEHDLRFTIEEARETAKAARVGVRDEELSEILSMTEGWPTALSFALRTSTRSVDLRNIAASTREMVYRYLAEQVYHSLEDDERTLLKLISYLHEIDLDVLSAAGYAKPKAVMEALRDRVAFVYPDRPGVYRCQDLFRDFLQHQVELEGVFAAERIRCEAARALETAGHVADALDVYARAKACADVVRILGVSGFDLMEHGHADVVQRALDAVPQDLRATNPVVLGMRGLSEAHAGRYDRAESLLSRAMTRSEDSALTAALAIRLALISINLGRDVTALLEPLLNAELPLHLRGEIVSLLAVGYANADHATAAKDAITTAETIAEDMDNPGDRAKVLQRLGVAAMRLVLPIGTVQQFLTTALALAQDNGMCSLAARAGAVLANMALYYENDATRCAWYAQQAMINAGKAGDRIGMQTALGQLIDVELTCGNADRIRKLGQQFADVAPCDAARMALVIAPRAVAVAWEGNFGEAHRLLSPVLERITENGDHAFYSAVCVLSLIADGQSERASALMKSVLPRTAVTTPFPYIEKQLGIARALCAAGEALDGRVAGASRVLKRLNSAQLPVVQAVRDAVAALLGAAKNPALRGEVLDRLQTLDTMGHGGVAKLLREAMAKCHRTDVLVSIVLTKAEVAVLQALADGQRPKDIALQTGRSVYTIHAHIQNIFEKLGCSGRNEALTEARNRGLLA